MNTPSERGRRLKRRKTKTESEKKKEKKANTWWSEVLPRVGWG